MDICHFNSVIHDKIHLIKELFHSTLVIAQRLMEAKPVKTSLLLALVLGTDPPSEDQSCTLEKLLTE